MTAEEDDEGCSNKCRRLICEWCPEYDRQAALVVQFKRELDDAPPGWMSPTS